jgi:hypothetical protein
MPTIHGVFTQLSAGLYLVQSMIIGCLVTEALVPRVLVRVGGRAGAAETGGTLLDPLTLIGLLP